MTASFKHRMHNVGDAQECLHEVERALGTAAFARVQAAFGAFKDGRCVCSMAPCVIAG
jgi:hypothetical protein